MTISRLSVYIFVIVLIVLATGVIAYFLHTAKVSEVEKHADKFNKTEIAPKALSGPSMGPFNTIKPHSSTAITQN